MGWAAWKDQEFKNQLRLIGDLVAEIQITYLEGFGRGVEFDEMRENLREVTKALGFRLSLVADIYAGLRDDYLAKIAASERREQKLVEARESALAKTVSINFDDAVDPHGFFVYLLWGDDPAKPLYVGESTNILARLGSHMQNADRRYKVRKVQVVRCRSELDMHRTESRLISHYQPSLNVLGIRS